MVFFVSISSFVGLEVTGFGDEEEVVDDEEEEDDDDDELDEEDEDEEPEAEDVVKDVSDSESLPSEALPESLCLKDGSTVGARTDRPGIINVALGDLLRFRSPTTIRVSVVTKKTKKKDCTLFLHFDIF